MKYNFDMMVLGGGAAGLSVASGAAQLGMKVLLVDKNMLGGDCLHAGCVPSKTLLASSHVAHTLRRAGDFGLEGFAPKPDMNAITKRIRDVQDIIQVHDSPERFRGLGVRVVFGAVQFTDSHTITVKLNPDLAEHQDAETKSHPSDDMTFSGKYIVIATGSRPFVPPIEGIKDVEVLTNETIFGLKTLPKSLAILGAGPIGCEMAQAFARLGTKVHLLYRKPHILDREDSDVAQVVEERFTQEGITLYPESDTLSMSKKSDQTLLQIQTKEGERDLEPPPKTPDRKVVGSLPGGERRSSTSMQSQAHQPEHHTRAIGSPGQDTVLVDHVLVSTGRKPNLELNLEAAGVEYTKRGIPTDARLRTNVRHIYAVGDVNGQYLFTHTAGYEAGIVVQNAVLGLPAKVDYARIPWTTFTDPEVASCGLNERAAKEKGATYTVIKHPFAKVDRALAEGETAGFVKILIDKKTRIIGGQIVGAHAGEMIHSLILARNMGMKLRDFIGNVHVYPTLAEATKIAAGSYFTPKLFSDKTRKILRWLYGYRGGG